MQENIIQLVTPFDLGGLILVLDLVFMSTNFLVGWTIDFNPY